MSTAALQNIWNGLRAQNLTVANKRWLADKLLEDVQDANLAPHTITELVQMAETGRQQIATGNSFTTEQVLNMCEKA